MRTILMKKTAAGPAGSFNAGHTYLVEEALAAAFVQAGAAEYADPAPVKEPPEEAKDEVIETATPVIEAEEAVKPRPVTRRKKK